MGLWRGTKKVIGHMIDLRVDQWVDFASLKRSTGYIKDYCQTLFSIKKSNHAEDYDEAVDRMGLSSEDIAKQAHDFLKLTLFFLVLATLLIIYGFIVFRLNNWMGTFICSALALYALTLAFRFHFWRFQLLQQKLGCSVFEWSRSLLPTKRKSQP
jgi:intracellular multiplication protein IcmV